MRRRPATLVASGLLLASVAAEPARARRVMMADLAGLDAKEIADLVAYLETL